MTESPNLTELIQLGQAAARVGRREEARGYLRRAVELAPDHTEAWLNLAGVEDDPAEKQACFETVQRLDPDNIEARLGLQMLEPEAAPVAEHAHEHELEAVMAQASRKLDETVGPPPAQQAPLDDQPLYCANHPTVETVLRCNRCSKPICTRCAVQTPVGYRCKQCVGQQQAVFYTGGALDYVIGGAIALVVGGIAALLVTRMGMWFIALILGPAIGLGIATIVHYAVRRRRSRYLWLVVAVCMVVGSLPALLLSLGSLWSMVAFGLFLVLAIGATSARLR